MESNHIHYSSHFQEELAATSDDHLFGNAMAAWPLNGVDLHSGDDMMNPQHPHYNNHPQSTMGPSNPTGNGLHFGQQQHIQLQNPHQQQQIHQPPNPAGWDTFNNMANLGRPNQWRGTDNSTSMMTPPQHGTEHIGQQHPQQQQQSQQQSQPQTQPQQQPGQHQNQAAMGFVPHPQPQFTQPISMPPSTMAYYPTMSAPDFQPLTQFTHDLAPHLNEYALNSQQSGTQPSGPFGVPGMLGTSPPNSLSFDHHSPASSSSWVEVSWPPSRTSFDDPNDHVNPNLVARSDGVSSPEGHVSPSHVSPGEFLNNEPFEDLGSTYAEAGSYRSLSIAIPPGRGTGQDVIMGNEGTSPSSQTTSAEGSASPTSPSSLPSNSSSKRKSGQGSQKSTKSTAKKPTPGAVAKSGSTTSGDRKVGRRKGPLAPDRRKQAGEIRKLRACLRCRFLKKTCDTGDPCQGCQPAHTRLWIVPCTRKGVNELHYFLYNWKADYERHMKIEFTPYNIKEYGKEEVALWITHGFDICLPVNARRAWAKDDSCFQMDWVETYNKDHPEPFECSTETLTTSQHGLDQKMLHQYVERHVDSDFIGFVDREFEGTAFLTEMLKVAYDYYRITNLPVVHKALKFVVAYNLTQHLTLIEGITDEAGYIGKIDDSSSRFHGKYVAPALINFEIKATLAQVWRQLHKEVLDELATLFAGSYSGNKTQNWPTIFVVCFVVLSMWELMQFDAHYHGASPAAAANFCQEMEGVPVGVLLGLFSAVSQKLPNFVEWDTNQHQQLVNFNQDICAIFTKVREHITKYESYLRERANTATFNADDFDCLCNKLTSKLVLKPATNSN